MVKYQNLCHALYHFLIRTVRQFLFLQCCGYGNIMCPIAIADLSIWPNRNDFYYLPEGE